MRFFRTTNASRRYTTGGLAVLFEAVENAGGSWLGVIAIESEEHASKLAAAAFPQVTEITQVEYDGLKKKQQPSNPSLRVSLHRPQSRLPMRVVEPAAPASTSSSKPAPAAPAGPATSLRSARIEVPDELKLDTGVRRAA